MKKESTLEPPFGHSFWLDPTFGTSRFWFLKILVFGKLDPFWIRAKISLILFGLLSFKSSKADSSSLRLLFGFFQILGRLEVFGLTDSFPLGPDLFLVLQNNSFLRVDFFSFNLLVLSDSSFSQELQI